MNFSLHFSKKKKKKSENSLRNSSRIFFSKIPPGILQKIRSRNPPKDCFRNIYRDSYRNFSWNSYRNFTRNFSRNSSKKFITARIFTNFQSAVPPWIFLRFLLEFLQELRNSLRNSWNNFSMNSWWNSGGDPWWVYRVFFAEILDKFLQELLENI